MELPIFILGQGLGLFNADGGWSGNLTSLNRTKGYWLNTNSPISDFNEMNFNIR